MGLLFRFDQTLIYFFLARTTENQRLMAITNFVITAAAVAAVASLMSRDVRSSTSMLRRNMKQMRVWLEDAAVEAKKPGEQPKLPGSSDKKPPEFKDPSA